MEGKGEKETGEEERKGYEERLRQLQAVELLSFLRHGSNDQTLVSGQRFSMKISNSSRKFSNTVVIV